MHRLVPLIAVIATLFACGPKTNPQPLGPNAPVAPTTEDPVTKPAQTMPPAKLPAGNAAPTDPVAEFLARCRTSINEAKAGVPAFEKLVAPFTVANTLEPLNNIMIALGRGYSMAGLMSEVHPDEAIREAARTCEQEAAQFATELSLNRAIYNAVAGIDRKGLDAATDHYLTSLLRDYRRAGVDKDEPTRARLRAIDEEITKLGQDFSKVIADDVRAIEFTDPAGLDGLPEDFKAAHPVDPKTGMIRVTTDYPDYLPFMSYATNDALRKQLYVANRSRGDKSNEATFAKILGLRAEHAKLLGYPNYAAYVIEDKMMKSAKKAQDFIDRVTKLARPRAKRDYAELLKVVKKANPKATAVADWQKTWAENQVKQALYDVDSALVRQYFPYKSVLAGLLDITATIYDIQYVPVAAATAKVWHKDVAAYDVMRAGKKLGRIFLDMHPREGKYKHAAQFTLLDGVAGRQLPEGVLVCNFPNPNDGGGAALMEHEDVVTMFHEFGHLMHHVLGGNQRWVRQSGVATEHDFVEAPSQMFEEWAWSHETLARFAKHHETGAVIPVELVAKMRKADKFGMGTMALQQMFYAAISLQMHTANPAKLDQLALVKKLQKAYTPFAYVEGTRFHASFGHLVGYSAMYYTYMWSLVIAKDLLTPFKDQLMNTAATHKYRDTVLAPGGTKDAADLVADFLGRPYNFKAFETYLSK